MRWAALILMLSAVLAGGSAAASERAEKGWRLVWSDEFDGAAIDLEFHSIAVGICVIERQCSSVVNWPVRRYSGAL